MEVLILEVALLSFTHTSHLKIGTFDDLIVFHLLSPARQKGLVLILQGATNGCTMM